jgi:hypothetical protein
MSPLKVACPLCRTVLLATPPFALGQKVKCSRCGTTFALAGAHATATTVGGSVARSHSAMPSRQPMPGPNVVAPRPNFALPDRFDNALSQSAGRSRWLALGLGVALLLVAGIGLTTILLLRGNRSNIDTPSPRDDETATVPARPAPIPLSAADEDGAPTRNRILDSLPPDARNESNRYSTTLSAEQQRAVNQALDKGIAYLKRKQQGNGTWTNNGHAIGYAALPGLTLLECGVKSDDPVVHKAAAFVRNNCGDLGATYEIALAALFLDRLGAAQDRPLIQKLALRLVAGQGGDGGWNYRCPVLTQDQHKTFLHLLEQLRPALRADLMPPIAEGSSPEKPTKPQTPKMTKEKRSKLPAVLKDVPALQDRLDIKAGRRGGTSDNSNSQFAILALWAAQRQGVAVERPLALVAQRYRPCQNQDGGWGYHSGGSVRTETTPSMTCVGLLGLAVGHGLARDGVSDQQSVEDPQIQEALEALGNHIGEPTGRSDHIQQDNLYFLWSLERVGVLYGLRAIAGKDWYAWGAEMLVANQLNEGKWQSGGYHGATPTLDTCFALLFLKRANLVHDLTKKIEYLKIDTRRRE